MLGFLKQIRVNHWIKNLLVFAPLLVSYRFFAFDYYTYGNFIDLCRLFFAFSFLASLSYIVNDFLDLEEDKKHPTKKKRPLASGEISRLSVLILGLILFVAAVLLSLDFNWKVQIILFAYLILNTLYSLKLKTIPLLEFFFIAFMYFLRLKAGGELFDLNTSDWLILMVFFLALFMIVGKRRSECFYLSKMDHSTRKVLSHYSVGFLDSLLNLLVAAILISYSLYAIEAKLPYLLYSVFFVFFGLFRYLYTNHRFNEGQTPEKELFRD